MNARFTTYVHGSPVTITLKPNKPVAHVEGGPTDEGYEWTRTVYEFDGDYVTATHDHESSCCDGRFSSNREMRCPVGLLKASIYRHKVYIDGQGPVVTYVAALPEWREIRRGQRDYFAEAAGY
jgi:hypothetical protein